MKKKILMKKGAVLVAAVMMGLSAPLASVTTMMPMAVEAATKAVTVTKTQSEAIAWCDSKVGTKVVGPHNHGGVCEDFAEAYMSYITDGALTGIHGITYKENSKNAPQNWTVTQNGPLSIGDLVAFNGDATKGYEHIGIYAGGKNFTFIYSQNPKPVTLDVFGAPDESFGEKGGYVVIHPAWPGNSTPTEYSDEDLQLKIGMCNPYDSTLPQYDNDGDPWWSDDYNYETAGDKKRREQAEEEAAKKAAEEEAAKKAAEEEAAKKAAEEEAAKKAAEEEAAKKAAEEEQKQKDQEPTTTFDDNTKSSGIVFTDVPSNSYYYDAVTWAVKNNITSGTSDTTFSPNDTCTRAQIVTFLYREAGSPSVTVTKQFTDVPANTWYTNAVSWAVQNGITLGTSDTKFSPNAKCTRAQAMCFLYRAKGNPTVYDKSLGFEDTQDGVYYSLPLAWAFHNGIADGTASVYNAQQGRILNYFSPNASCTRGQIVTFMYRAKAFR